MSDTLWAGPLKWAPTALSRKIRPSLAVSPSHADSVLVHPGPEFRHRFPAILLATSSCFAGYAVDDPRGPAGPSGQSRMWSSCRISAFPCNRVLDGYLGPGAGAPWL